MSFSANIQPFVTSELMLAKRCAAEGDPDDAFKHLENAHVLGQRSTKWHVVAHYQMLLWALNQRELRECLGQVLRLVGALTKTAFGLVPIGNTGGSNVSPFQSLPISAEHARIIEEASST